MRLLLDTHLLVWASLNPDRLPTEVLRLATDPSNDLLFSVASVWELAIKQSLRKPDFVVDTVVLRQALLASRFEELPVTGEHALAVRNMPFLHRDPFDRILVAQATVEHVTLITADRTVARYPGPIRHFAAPSGVD